MRPPLTVRVHAMIERSFGNGPGPRAVIWVQGCSIHCSGCFNPRAQASGGGRAVPIADVLRWITAIPAIEGLTISGGEPLEQPEALFALLSELRRSTDLSILMFTGHPWERIVETPAFLAVASLCDVVVAGPFDRHLPLGHGLRGSSNQTTHLLTDRYSWLDIEEVPGLEIVIGDRTVVATGVVHADLN